MGKANQKNSDSEVNNVLNLESVARSTGFWGVTHNQGKGNSSESPKKRRARQFIVAVNKEESGGFRSTLQEGSDNSFN
jgi:hypothetical protein